MDGIFSRLSTRNWIFYVTLMCFVLGALIAANLNTQASLKDELGIQSSQSGGRLPWLVEALKEQRNTNENLNLTIKELRIKAEGYEEELAKRGKQAQTINTELQDLKFLAGLTPVKGPGLIITLDDNRNKPLGEPDSDLYIVHDYDLRNLVNELMAGGAEAIAINDQRITSRTAIRCVGPSTMINGQPTAAPFIVTVIGSPKDLEGVMNIPNGVGDILRMGVKVRIERGQNLEAPAYSGPTNFRYAKPIPMKQAKE